MVYEDTNMNVQRYLDKSGDERIFMNNLVRNEHGFASYYVDGEHLQILNVYGDGDYWDEFLTGIAIKNGCRALRFSTLRNPKALERSRGCKVIGYIMEREVDNG